MNTSQYTPYQAAPVAVALGQSVLDKGHRPALRGLQQQPVTTPPAVTGALGAGWLPHQLGVGHAPQLAPAAPVNLGAAALVPTQPGLDGPGGAIGAPRGPGMPPAQGYGGSQYQS